MGVNKININNNDSNYTHSIFDISEYTGKTYDTLSDALADVPDGKKKGGMTVAFVSTGDNSDNKYVQYICKTSVWSSTPTDWEKINNVSVSQDIEKTNIEVGTNQYQVYDGIQRIGLAEVANTESDDEVIEIKHGDDVIASLNEKGEAILNILKSNNLRSNNLQLEHYPPLVSSEVTDDDEVAFCNEDEKVAWVDKNGIHSKGFYDEGGKVLSPILVTAIQNIFAGIPSVGIVGDSLSIGASGDGRAVQDNAQYAWWRVLERDSGMTYRRYAQGGLSTRTWLTNQSYGLPAAVKDPCHCYIIALEVNDRAILNQDSSYLGSLADIDLADPDNNADTYYGNLAKIIQKLKVVSPNARFLVMNNPRSGDDALYAQLNQAISDVVALFTYCHLVDMVSLFGAEYTEQDSFIENMCDYTRHYPSCAYAYMGKLCEYAIGITIEQNYRDYKTIQFALD